MVGSKNSSNSRRLTEIALAAGTRAELIDDMSELNPGWFDGVESILITAGASAPEDLVQDLIFRLNEDYGGEIELVDVHHETTEFGLPGTLKDFMRERGAAPDERRLYTDPNEAMLAWLDFHGIPRRRIDLTVGGSEA